MGLILLICGGLIGLVLLGVALCLFAALAFGAFLVWQLSLILIILGGFIGGPVGAGLGFTAAGIIGLAVVKLSADN